MIDINTIISQALTAAVQQATAPLLERIAALESQSDALLNRVNTADVVAGHLHERAAALESQSADQHVRLIALGQRISGLETATQTEEMLQHLDNQEWFWEKIREFTGNVVEQAVEQHCEEYDHDDMLMSDALPDMDDYIKREDLDSEVRDAVRDIMEGATVSIRI